jgi:hypothetical protein
VFRGAGLFFLFVHLRNEARGVYYSLGPLVGAASLTCLGRGRWKAGLLTVIASLVLAGIGAGYLYDASRQGMTCHTGSTQP